MTSMLDSICDDLLVVGGAQLGLVGIGFVVDGAQLVPGCRSGLELGLGLKFDLYN